MQSKQPGLFLMNRFFETMKGTRNMEESFITGINCFFHPGYQNVYLKIYKNELLDLSLPSVPVWGAHQEAKIYIF